MPPVFCDGDCTVGILLLERPVRNRLAASLVTLAFASVFAFQAGSIEKPSHRVGFALLAVAGIAGFLIVNMRNAHGLIRTTLAIVAIVGTVWGTGYIFIKL